MSACSRFFVLYEALILSKSKNKAILCSIILFTKVETGRSAAAKQGVHAIYACTCTACTALVVLLVVWFHFYQK